MELIKQNEKGNYEYTEEQFNQLQENVYNIYSILQVLSAYCEFYLFDVKQISPIAFLTEIMKKELRKIYCKF